MRKIRAKELLRYGITPEQSSVLFVINAIGARATPAEISRCISREPHSVSGLLSRMEKEGLVERFKDLDRKNMIRIAMTEKGKKAYQQTIKRDSIHKVMSCLSPEERRQLRANLEKLWNKALEELGLDDRIPLLFSE